MLLRNFFFFNIYRFIDSDKENNFKMTRVKKFSANKHRKTIETTFHY